jgi:hypothetical protein
VIDLHNDQDRRPVRSGCRSTGDPSEFARFRDLVDPGLVYLPKWRPGEPDAVRDAESVWMLGAVGRKR